MSMTVPVAQMRIARDISAAEQALDYALIRLSSLMPAMFSARRDTGASPSTGNEALLRLAKAQQALLEAGGNLARVHGSLLDVQREMNVGDECPPDEPMGQLERVAG